jgi:poly-gamma-glutamate synthase PgsB/CapB
MPIDVLLIDALPLLVAGALVIEWRSVRSARRHISIRIHVNGTRGKSSVTRLIAAALRAHGIRTLSRTTGTSAMLSLPDGSEIPIERHGPASIRELIRTMRRCRRADAEAVVVECMAVHPDLQAVAERRIVQPTVTAITNARLDHTDVQGTSVEAIAAAFPVLPGGTLVTADPLVAVVHGPKVRRDGGVVRLASTAAITQSELRTLPFLEHAENVALALEVVRLVGVPRETALAGMRHTVPDPGVAAVIRLDDHSGSWWLVNLFAANDPQSTFRAMDAVDSIEGSHGPPILLFAARGDRGARSDSFASALSDNRDRFSEVVVWGERTRAIAARFRKNLEPSRVVDAGRIAPPQLTQTLLHRMNGCRVVVGIGNIIGPSQRWLSYLDASGGVITPGRVAEGSRTDASCI